MNLVVNARDAMPDGGKLEIDTANVEMMEGYMARQMGATPGRYVQLSVTDTGFGMDEIDQVRFFEPFFTTKEMGKGTGLGLSTVYGIVKQSGGSIWVDSEPGRGTTLRSICPAILPPLRRCSPCPARLTPGALGQRPSWWSRTRRHWQDSQTEPRSGGLHRADFASGEEALAACARAAREDSPSPHRRGDAEDGGGALQRRMIRTRPTLKVLHMSGYTDEAIDYHGVLDAGAHFLGKPFTAAALRRKVREVLGPRGLLASTGQKDLVEVLPAGFDVGHGLGP